MYDYLNKVFEKFDPLTGHAPYLCQTKFESILARARTIITYNSIDSLSSILREVSQITDSGDAVLTSDSNQPAYIDHAIALPTLFRRQADEDLLFSEYLYQYFVVIALALVGYVHLVHKGRRHAQDTNHFDTYIEIVCAEAEQCVSIAENLSRA